MTTPADPLSPKSDALEPQQAGGCRRPSFCSRFATDDARLLQLRGASTKQLIDILAESVSTEASISPAYFAVGMDFRFRETQPEELRELLATVILERRGANDQADRLEAKQ